MTSTRTTWPEVAACMPALRRYARKLVRHNPEDADDLVQATMERALRLLKAKAEMQDVEAYLIRVLRNLYLDRVRRRGREQPVEGQIFDKIPSPANQDISLLCGETLKEIAAMPAPMRTLMKMAAEGASYREISEALDVPVGTVTSRLARARAQLARRVGWAPGVAA